MKPSGSVKDRVAEAGNAKIGSAYELVESANKLEVSYGPALYHGLSLADIAHVIILNYASVIPAAAAAKLLSVLLDMHKIPGHKFNFDPALGDAYKNREKYIITAEPEAGGWLRTGRARREATNIAYNITLRSGLLRLHEALVKFIRAVTEISEKHIVTIMPDFTYLQHAQPTTFGHYLLGFAFPALRDIERLQSCFEHVNMCPGGIGSVNGSRLPISREKLANILGFYGPVLHTRDAMWQADMQVEILAVLNTAVINIDRLGEDFQIWATHEFDLIELAPGYCRESVIMPQKKNPYSLAFIRGAASVLSGKLAAMANVGRTVSGQPDNRIFAYGDVPAAIELAAQTVELMAAVVATLTVNKSAMAARANEGYSQATDLAEVIMQQTGISYMSAHRLVTAAVKAAAKENIPAVNIKAKLLNDLAGEILGQKLNLSSSVLKNALLPNEIVATRTGLGGAAPERTAEMIAEARKSFSEAEKWRLKTAKKINKTENELINTAERIIR